MFFTQVVLWLFIGTRGYEGPRWGDRDIGVGIESDWSIRPGPAELSCRFGVGVGVGTFRIRLKVSWHRTFFTGIVLLQ